MSAAGTLQRRQGDADSAALARVISGMASPRELSPVEKLPVEQGFDMGREAAARMIEKLGAADADMAVQAWSKWAAYSLRTHLRFADGFDRRRL